MHTTPDPQHYTASPSFLERLFGLRSPASQPPEPPRLFGERAFDPPPAAAPPLPLALTVQPVPPSIEALRLAVDAARADFTAALAGLDRGLTDKAAHTYGRAATAYRQAQEARQKEAEEETLLRSLTPAQRALCEAAEEALHNPGRPDSVVYDVASDTLSVVSPAPPPPRSDYRSQNSQ